MATKLQNISELARQTTERLTQSVDNWKRFLDSAAWLYKYPFHEQVLIHAQRPDAKACAPIELWNSRFRRWVNRGAKGIALIDDSGMYSMYPTPIPATIFRSDYGKRGPNMRRRSLRNWRTILEKRALTTRTSLPSYLAYPSTPCRTTTAITTRSFSKRRTTAHSRI